MTPELEHHRETLLLKIADLRRLQALMTDGKLPDDRQRELARCVAELVAVEDRLDASASSPEEAEAEKLRRMLGMTPEQAVEGGRLFYDAFMVKPKETKE
jgi:hypothetical protein